LNKNEINTHIKVIYEGAE